MDRPTPEDRYKLWLAWQNSLFNAYFDAQQSLGLTREEALERLRAVWAREDQERLEAHRRVAEVLARAG